MPLGEQIANAVGVFLAATVASFLATIFAILRGQRKLRTDVKQDVSAQISEPVRQLNSATNDFIAANQTMRETMLVQSRLLERYDKRLPELEKTISDNKALIDELLDDKRSMGDKLTRLENVQSEAREASKRRDQQLAALEVSLQTVTSELNQAKAHLKVAQEELERTRAELDAAHKRIDEIERERVQGEVERQRLNTELDAERQKVTALTDKVRLQEAEIERLNREVDKLRAKLNTTAEVPVVVTPNESTVSNQQ
jgi:chromosome segregation ATPase